MSASRSFPWGPAPLLAVLATWALLPAAAAEAGTAADTRWLCWDNRDTTLRCRLLAASARPTADVPEAAPVDRRRDLYPRRGPLPPIVGAILDTPERFHSRTIVIPMFSEPLETAFAEQLARAVMCGGRPSCTVQFARSPSAAALLAEDDPALE